jgi:predicted RNA-binding Zn-ribbon protein involved in translation (DUF1610 family)
MHRTLNLPEDEVAYAKAALATLLVFEQRYRPVTFPECEWEERTIDQEAVSLLSWLSEEKDIFFKKANEYLQETGAAHGYLNCPQCGTYHVTERRCRVCRARLELFECRECEYESYELAEEMELFRGCPECGAGT